MRHSFKKISKANDELVNKTVIDFVIFTSVGYISGLAASIFFKNKSIIRAVVRNYLLIILNKYNHS